jgi:hypothetical protein
MQLLPIKHVRTAPQRSHVHLTAQLRRLLGTSSSNASDVLAGLLGSVPSLPAPAPLPLAAGGSSPSRPVTPPMASQAGTPNRTASTAVAVAALPLPIALWPLPSIGGDSTSAPPLTTGMASKVPSPMEVLEAVMRDAEAGQLGRGASAVSAVVHDPGSSVPDKSFSLRFITLDPASVFNNKSDTDNVLSLDSAAGLADAHDKHELSDDGALLLAPGAPLPASPANMGVITVGAAGLSCESVTMAAAMSPVKGNAWLAGVTLSPSVPPPGPMRCESAPLKQQENQVGLAGALQRCMRAGFPAVPLRRCAAGALPPMLLRRGTADPLPVPTSVPAHFHSWSWQAD